MRAYAYLAARSDGASQAEANELTNRIDTYAAAQMNDAMGEFVKFTFKRKSTWDGFRSAC